MGIYIYKYSQSIIMVIPPLGTPTLFDNIISMTCSNSVCNRLKNTRPWETQGDWPSIASPPP